MTAMDRIYRIEWGGETRHAIERDGVLSLVRGDIFGRYELAEQVASGSGTSFAPTVRVLAPVVPGKIVAIGLNYKDHAAEQGKPLPVEPMIFLKPSTAVIAPGDPIRLPAGVGRIDHEAEMAIVIGRRATRVPVERAAGHILGVTCANDVTARDLQNRGVQYSHVKGSTPSRRSARASRPVSTRPTSPSRDGSTASAGRHRARTSWCSPPPS
jgi:2-keto-4-pentenoate hydratase/2-oxohepta-3-ene-1,7-dioic acid hydratase in catechol pathway